MHGMYVHARVDDLDRDARSQWIGEGNKSALNYSTTEQAITMKLASTVGHVLRDLDFANVYMA